MALVCAAGIPTSFYDLDRKRKSCTPYLEIRKLSPESTSEEGSAKANFKAAGPVPSKGIEVLSTSTRRSRWSLSNRVSLNSKWRADPDIGGPD